MVLHGYSSGPELQLRVAPGETLNPKTNKHKQKKCLNCFNLFVFQIHFICGLTDKIVHVSEEEKCSYYMKFSTPAAC